MNNEADSLDQAEEEILTFSVRDEAIEAAANARSGGAFSHPSVDFCQPSCGYGPGCN